MHLSRIILAIIATAFLVGAPIASHAQSGAETLTAAAKLSEKGDHAAAVEKISEAFKSGKLDNAASSKAFLMRAEAYEKLNKDALALADYTSAVFMQGLSTTDRPRAVDGRKRTLAALGVSEDDGGAKPLAAAPAQEESKPSSSGGFLSGLFGGSSTSSDAKREEAAPANNWSQGTRVTAPPTAASPSIQSTSTPVRQAAVAENAKQYNVLLASVPSEDIAKAEVKRMTTQLASSLQGRTPEVIRYEKGGAVFFRVVAGPYEGSALSKEVCDSVKTKNVKCLVISR